MIETAEKLIEFSFRPGFFSVYFIYKIFLFRNLVVPLNFSYSYMYMVKSAA